MYLLLGAFGIVAAGYTNTPLTLVRICHEHGTTRTRRADQARVAVWGGRGDILVRRGPARPPDRLRPSQSTAGANRAAGRGGRGPPQGLFASVSPAVTRSGFSTYASRLQTIAIKLNSCDRP